jgi:hypothetical protein
MKRRYSRGVPYLDVLSNSKSLKCRDSRGVPDLDVLNNSEKNPEMTRFQRGLISRRFGLYETKFRSRKVSFYFKKYLIFCPLLFQRLAKTSPAAVAVTVSPCSSPQKRSPSALGNTLRSKFKKGKLPVKDSGVDANYVKEKEGTFDLEILYPINLFDIGAKAAPFFIKVVHYHHGNIELVFIFNNEYFTKALTDLVDSQKVNGVYPDLGLPYLNTAIREIDGVATRANKFDEDDTQECCHGKFLSTYSTTFVKCDASSDDTLDRIKGFAEWM